MHEIHGDQHCLGEGERNQEPDFDNRREPHGVDQQFDRGQDRQINENCYVVGLGVCFVSLMCYRLSRHSYYRSPPVVLASPHTCWKSWQDAKSTAPHPWEETESNLPDSTLKHIASVSCSANVAGRITYLKSNTQT